MKARITEMSEPPTTSESVTGQSADWVSTILSVPLIWPKTTALSAFGLVGLATGLWYFSNSTPAGPPPLKAAVLQQMLRAVEEADRRVRTEHGLAGEQSTEVSGVFETMRDRPRPLADLDESANQESKP